MVVFDFFRLLRLSLWRAFWHDVFGVAKGAAYSLILSLFPGFMLVASILAAFNKTGSVLNEISYALGRILPPGTASTAQTYFQTAQARPIRVLLVTSLITLWTASGVMISWMEGFRNAYQLPKTWGVVKERFIAFGLVIMAGIPLTFASFLVVFGNQIEAWLMHRAGHSLGFFILTGWTIARWIIAILTSIAVMALIYHYAVPRTQRWHSVMPGATLGTALWFPSTMIFGWYVSRFAEYSLFYGSLATAIVLLVWMYIVSIIMLIGAEFNALLFPRLASVGKVKKTPLPSSEVRAG